MNLRSWSILTVVRGCLAIRVPMILWLAIFEYRLGSSILFFSRLGVYGRNLATDSPTHF